MKHHLRKTEARKFVLFTAFVVLVFVVLGMDAKAERQGATVAAAVQALD